MTQLQLRATLDLFRTLLRWHFALLGAGLPSGS